MNLSSEKHEKYLLVKESTLTWVMEKLERLESLLTKPTQKKKTVYNEKAAADYLTISQKSLQNLRRAGEIAFTRIDGGRRVLYTQEHLDSFLEKNQIKSKHKR